MIIQSLLNTDLYKMTMMQAVLHQFPGVQVEYKFKCRNRDVDLTPIIPFIKEEITSIGLLKFERDDLDYLAGLRFIKSDFVDFLRIFRLDPSMVSVTVNADAQYKGDNVEIRVKGPWLHTILWEIYILSIVNELYFRYKYNGFIPGVSDEYSKLLENGREILDKKIHILANAPEGFGFAEFGTRRRFSSKWQNSVVKILVENSNKRLLGTSNVMLAQKYNLTPIGTMAHEWLQAGQAMDVRLCNSQKFMLDAWVREYRGDLGIALTDIVGVDAFLRDFDAFFAKLYDGVRHDSGDPYVFGEKIIAHYQKIGIDPKTKNMVFTDGLDIPKAIDLFKTFSPRARVSFGIGTNMTNDMGVPPLNIVMKMVRCNGSAVAKLSDSPGKEMCEDQNYVDYLRSVFSV